MNDHNQPGKHLRIHEKLSILADAAKYDVSCSSSGSKRKNKEHGLGDATGMGICHSYTEDGRCVSLLKILLTNYCIFDCSYCVSRKSNDVKRATFTVEEVVDLTINFYRRNFIEGLFLSSGIFKNADFTMERLVRVARTLRSEYNFNGYIHLKTIPGASEELMKEAGLYADRLSVNIELPSETSLKLLAPEKNYKDIITPMSYLGEAIVNYKEERKVIKSTPVFAPAGQSTQMVIGATKETDKDILFTANHLYSTYNLKRVYYSGYVPIRMDGSLPAIGTAPPVIREHRLYQSDWLMRFYKFDVNEIVNARYPTLDLEIDPKLSYALRNFYEFPVDVNSESLQRILKVPGIGVKSAHKIISARKFSKLSWDMLRRIGVAVNKAKHFAVCKDSSFSLKQIDPVAVRGMLLSQSKSKFQNNFSPQLSLF